MKRRAAAILGTAAAVLMLTGCGDKIDGEWDICDENGDKIRSIDFFEDDMEMRLDDGETGEYEMLDDSRIKLEWDDDGFDELYGGRFDYEILSKDNCEIYIEEFSELLAEKSLNEAARILRNAAVTTIVELDETGVSLNGYWIFASDEEYCMFPSDVNEESFKKRILTYFPDAKNYEYIIVIEKGSVKDIYISAKWDSSAVGKTSDSTERNGENLHEIAEELIG